LIQKVFIIVKDDLLAEQQLKRTEKHSIFTTTALQQLVSLYTRTQAEGSLKRSPADLVHEFLLETCTVPGQGICVPDDGWYPAMQQDDPNNKQHIRNFVISRIVTLLKPMDSRMQRDLLLRVVESVPEMFHSFWSSQSASFEPRLASRWLALVSILQQTLSLDIPPFRTYPPSSATLLDNICPQPPLSRPLLVKAIHHKNLLVRFEALLLLVAVFQRFAQVTKAAEHIIAQGGVDASLWKQRMDAVRYELGSRLPDVQSILSNVSGTAVDANEMLQVAALKVLAHYYQWLPEMVVEAKFDVGKLLSTNLTEQSIFKQRQILSILMHADFKWSARSSSTTWFDG
jgi:hypothetical protein